MGDSRITHKPPVVNGIGYFNYVAGECCDPHGKFDDEKISYCSSGNPYFVERCPCVGCVNRRKKRGDGSKDAFDGPSFLTTRTDLIVGFLRSLVRGGLVIGSWELMQWLNGY